MRKLLLVTALTLFACALHAGTFRAKSGKAEYFRYELVDFYCELKNGRSLLGMETATPDKKKKSECTAKIFYRNRQVETVGSTREITLRYDDAKDMWSGKWPIPWNPRLGDYKAVISLKHDGKRYAAGVPFRIKGRDVPPLPKGFSVMDIEPGDSIIKRVPGVGGKSVKIWENYLLWSKFMGADALWHLVGQSQIWNEMKENFPWDNTTVNQAAPLSKECHKVGIKYGAWISSFLMIGNRLDLAPYRRTVAYDRDTGNLRELIYISINDERRHNDMISLMKRLNDIPTVDYIGLDYVRTDFGGYEYVSDFVADMPVREVPIDWKEMDEDDRRLWIAEMIDIEKHEDVIELWQWWRAHKMATIIKKLKEQAGVTKPLWAFTLTWRQGKEHGQDPLMFRDAGIDYNAGMFYSIEKQTYPMMIDTWRDYLKYGNTNLVAGQCVDWNLLGRTYDPSGPEEHYWRQEMLIDKVLPVNPSLGLFWHDLTRAFKGSRGPYTALEWAIAGGATFSYLRQKQGVFPFQAEWECPDSVRLDEIFTVEVNIRNTAEITTDYYIKLLKLSNLEMSEDLSQKFYLAPGEIKTITFQIRALGRDYRKRNRQMIAYMLQYGGLETQQRYFDFKYVDVE